MAKAKKNIFLGNTHPAVISVWAALIAAAMMLPTVPFIGTGGTMSVATLLLPLAGIFFGAIPGALAASIGRFIGQLIAPATAVFGVFSFLIGTVAALAAGMLWDGKWWQTPLLALLLTGLWFTDKIGRGAYLIAITFYAPGFVTSVFSGLVGRKWLKSKNVLLKSIAVYLISFSAMVVSTILANYLMLYIYKTPVITWKLLAIQAPIERLIFAAGSMIIGVPLLLGLNKIGIAVGPQEEEEEVLDAELDEE